MVFSFENVSEELWSAAVEQMRGKLEGTRVLVWVNYDIISLHKIFYLLEKGSGRVVHRDFPLPVFWDEEMPSASRRLEQLQQAIDAFRFSDLPPFAISNSEEDWDTWGDEREESISDALSDTSIVESLVTEDSLSLTEDGLSEIEDEIEKEFTEEEAMERIRSQFSLYAEED
jgi:hypothetical protein